MPKFIYTVNLDYKEFYFTDAIPAMTFAETALMHNPDVKVSIDVKTEK